MIRLLIGLVFFVSSIASAVEMADNINWVKVKASTSAERTAILEMGFAIENVQDDYVIVLATDEELENLSLHYYVETHFEMSALDFPIKDERFHNYAELTQALVNLARANPDIVSLKSIGKSVEGRNIWALTITRNQAQHLQQPGVLFMGGHHAREHLSVEMPLMLAQQLVAQYRRRDPRISRYLNTRSIYIIPVVNPDGKEYDIAGARYKAWRKNRRRNDDGSYGVDLNRNYSFQWGTVGTSKNPKSQTYCGKSPFSEPETQAVRAFYLNHPNLMINLSYHTYSELILFPWGHKHEKMSKGNDYRIHAQMAQDMARMNGYKPQQASDLYLVSGDTSDWAYGKLGLISFTFELDPKNMFQGAKGFYPGQRFIEPVFRKNWKPALYLIELAQSPSRVLRRRSGLQYGLSSPILE